VTCIVGLVDNGKVYIGGDSAGVAGLKLAVRADQKVFHNGPMIFGFTTSFRMGQLLRYAFTVPDHDPRVDVDRYMVTTFVDALRTCLKAGGFAKKTNEEESAGTFLVGYQGRLFRVEEDYQVGFNVVGFDAVGCGEQIAQGALYASQGNPAQERVKQALEAAEYFSAGVRQPFVVEEL
jgi:ATP-dependent protease HslVU (ClpYQ) peptidase subunit